MCVVDLVPEPEQRYLVMSCAKLSSLTRSTTRYMDTTVSHVMLGPAGISVCFASQHMPFELFIFEAAATASSKSKRLEVPHESA